MLTKSLCATMLSAVRAAAGVSTRIPISTDDGRPANDRTRCENHEASRASVTMGAMTATRARQAFAARASAVSWSSSIRGCARSARSPRTPSAGLGSAEAERKGSGLSPPASSIRTTTTCPVNIENTDRKAFSCSKIEGAVLARRYKNSVRNNPTPSAPAATANGNSSGRPMFANKATGTLLAVRPGSGAETDGTATAPSAAPVVISTVPRPPSTMTSTPSGSDMTSSHPTIAGIPSARAKIAVWLVGPPSTVTIASTWSRHKTAVSAGDSECAVSTNG